MFIGHMAVGFASKRVAPGASLGPLMAAPLTLDLLWPFFLMTRLEKVRIDPGNTVVTPLDFVSYPYSHSLTASAGWAVLFGLGYWAITRYATGALVISVGVISHWLFDALTHRADLPLFPVGSVRVGLGLWNSLPGTIAVEGVLFAAGVWLYASSTRARDRIGTYGFWAFVAFAAISYLANLFGPPPPNADFLAKFALSLWIFPLWAWWFDRHRQVVGRLVARHDAE